MRRLTLSLGIALAGMLACASCASALALQPGTILVADSAWSDGNGAIVAIDPGTGGQQILSSGQEFVDPVDVLLSPRGQLYVADREADATPGGAVIRVDPTTGAQTVVAAGPLLGIPTAIAREASGNLLVTDEQLQGVVRVDPASLVNSPLSSHLLIENPSGITIDEQQRVILSNRDSDTSPEGSVLEIDPLTGEQSLIAENPDPVDPGQLRDPTDVFSNRRGGLFVVDEASTTMGMDDGGLLFITSEGALEQVSMAGSFVDPQGGAMTTNGDVLVADAGAFRPDFVGAVIRVNPVTGEQATLAREGELVDPADLIVVPDRCKGRYATIQGTKRADTITGSPYADVIVTYRGRDRVNAGGGNDVVCGGAGSDALGGAKGRDNLFGQTGNDKLFGGTDKDRLFGGPGRDLRRP